MLTDAGHAAVRLVVGISEGLAKLAVRKLMQPVMHAPHLRLLCRENDFEDLLGDFAIGAHKKVLHPLVPMLLPVKA